jgi:hypothetical protein
MRALTLLAGGVTPDNTPHGYNLTFAIPIALFAVVAVVLSLKLGRPHRRIPARPAAASGATAVASGTAAPQADAAQAAAIAGGLSVAPGGGQAESHLEPAGHTYAEAASAPADAGSPEGAGEHGPPGNGAPSVPEDQ